MEARSMGNAIRKPDQVFDIRLIERYRAKGMFTEKEIKKFLAELPDGQENALYSTAKDILGDHNEDSPRRD
jgi:hypothetical protein